jgi:1-acyl-sn-glycerol-3-phosphate acyltransferase
MPTTANASAPGGRLDAQALLDLIDGMLAELHPAASAIHARLDDAIERDLGIDSLSRIELAARVERSFGRVVPDEALLAARTPRELLDALAQARTAVPAPDTTPVASPEMAAGAPDAVDDLAAVFAWHVERHPGREHITLLEGDDVVASLTYGVLWSRAQEVAAGLFARGVRRGDTVALMLPTCCGFFEAFLGALLLCAVPVPLYPPARWSEIEEHVRGRAAIMANCGARLLVTVEPAALAGRVLRALVHSLAHVVTVDDLRVAHASVPAHHPAAAQGDIALLQYTSGSTGDPKGVVLTHANLLANIRVMGRAARATSADRFVSWLPLYHDMGLIGAWLASAYHAVPLVVMPPTSFLARPVRWLRAIHRYRGSLSAAPNFAYEIAAAKIADADLAGLDLSCWRIAFNGAEPVRAATLDRFARRMAPLGFDARAFTPVYGLAETALGLTFPPLERGPRIDRIDAGVLARDGVARPVAATAEAMEVVGCGMPLPAHEVRIVDGGGEVPVRHEGRIEFRGPSATRGYYANPAATRMLLHDGWLDTGDIGYLAEGELFVTSRAKDLIKRGGHNLHPYDLESAVGDMPGIRKGCVAVFGTADPATGSERVVVVAETHERNAAPRQSLVAAIQALAEVHLDGPADAVLLVPPRTLRKTSSGKIRRAACRDLYERGLLTVPRRAVAGQLLALAGRALAARARRNVRALLELAWGLYAAGAFVAIAAGGLAALAVTPGLPRRLRLVHRAAALLLRATGLPAAAIFDEPGLPVPAVLVVNHASYADAIVLAALLPPGWRFTAKREFARIPLVGFGMRRAGVQFVPRDDPARAVAATRELGNSFKAGNVLVHFPEGTFTRAPGLGPFRLGAFVAALDAQVPVVPLALRGTRDVLPDGRRLPRRRPVTLRRMATIQGEGSGWHAAVRLRDRARAAIAAHCGEPDLEWNGAGFEPPQFPGAARDVHAD